MEKKLQILYLLKGHWLLGVLALLWMPLDYVSASTIADQQVIGKVTADNGEVLAGVNVTLEGNQRRHEHGRKRRIRTQCTI